MQPPLPSAEGFDVLCSALERECADVGLPHIASSPTLRMWAGELDGSLVRVEATTGGGPHIFWTRAEAKWLWPHQYVAGDDVSPTTENPDSPWNGAALNDQFCPLGHFWTPPDMAGWQDPNIVESEMWPRVVKERMAVFRQTLATPPR